MLGLHENYEFLPIVIIINKYLAKETYIWTILFQFQPFTTFVVEKKFIDLAQQMIL